MPTAAASIFWPFTTCGSHCVACAGMKLPNDEVRTSASAALPSAIASTRLRLNFRVGVGLWSVIRIPLELR